MFNEMMQLLSDVPPTLAAGWAVWFGTGALLVMWYRKAKANFEMEPAVGPGATRGDPRESGPRPAPVRGWRREPRPVTVAVPRPKPVADRGR